MNMNIESRKSRVAEPDTDGRHKKWMLRGLRYGRAVWPMLFMVLFAALCLYFFQVEAAARIQPARIFQSGMVLQRGKPVPVWGRALPGQHLALSFAGQHVSVRVDSAGRWEAWLAPLSASAAGAALALEYDPPLPWTHGGRRRLELRDVLVGDLWLCAGQSNMEFGCARLRGEEAAALPGPERGGTAGGAGRAESGKAPGSVYPAAPTRIFLIEKAAGIDPSPDLASGRWQPATAASLKSGGWGGFSAVAYFFAERLHRDINIPIGLIQSAYGATRIADWLPRSIVDSDAHFAAEKKVLAAIDADPVLRVRFAVIKEKKDVLPASCYNAMISPLEPMALKGILWYQGETDMGSGMQYAAWLRALIACWRTHFRDSGLPFYYVALPGYKYGRDGQLPEFTEAQASCRDVPASGMAVIIDRGDYGDIHPPRKADVGIRLALLALHDLYGETSLEAQSPCPGRVRTCSIDDRLTGGGSACEGLEVDFSHCADGLIIKGVGALTDASAVQDSAAGVLSRAAGASGADPRAFEIAGTDGIFFPASAMTRGTELYLWSSQVPQPCAARYAWSNNPRTYIYNAEGLPAAAFRISLDAGGKQSE